MLYREGQVPILLPEHDTAEGRPGVTLAFAGSRARRAGLLAGPVDAVLAGYAGLGAAQGAGAQQRLGARPR